MHSDASLIALIQSHAGVGTRFEQVRNQCVLIFVVAQLIMAYIPQSFQQALQSVGAGPT